MGSELKTVLRPALTQVSATPKSKKKVLQYLAQLISSHYPHLTEDSLFDSLVAREKLGSTGIGHGIAIPHCRFEGCDVSIGALLTLESPVDFESIDSEPVDIVFALLVPQDGADDHLATLAQIAGRLNDETLRTQIRQAKDADELFQLVI